MTDYLDLSPDHIAGYLRRHANFLADYPDLALTLVMPREAGVATSLTNYQLEILREKNRSLSTRLRDLVTVAEENQALVGRVHQLALRLLRAATFRDTVLAIAASLREDFHTDLVRVCLTGMPRLALDEAWLMLGHPVFRDKIREWLKVLRKANCAVVLATQSISDAERSGIIDVLKESCPTKICLPNGGAREPGTREFYERLGYNERQVEIVSNAIPKREYYVTSPVGRRLFNMALGPIALAFVGASGREDLKRITELNATHGRRWPSNWLHTRGIAHADTLFADE